MRFFLNALQSAVSPLISITQGQVFYLVTPFVGFLLHQFSNLFVGGQRISGICLSAGHVYEYLPKSLEIDGIVYTTIPLYSYLPFQLQPDRDPISGSYLSDNADFFAFLLSPITTTTIKLTPGIPQGIPPSPGQIARVEGIPAKGISQEIAAPWAREDDEKKEVRRMVCMAEGKPVESKGEIIRVLNGIIACKCTTLAGMSGSPLSIEDHIIGILHGGPAVEGHHALCLACAKLNDLGPSADLEHIKRIIEGASFLWDEKDKDVLPLKAAELKEEALAIFDQNLEPLVVKKKLLKIYTKLLGVYRKEKISYNIFLGFCHKEMRLFGNCYSRLITKLEKGGPKVEYVSLADFVIKEFGEFIHRNLRFGINHPKIGVIEIKTTTNR
eukprot:TRINITY_DN2696_c0_g1_i1.p1 TRINITY_DN2696_c0_g1~~TRINITY_DN2696_c0_g1_i1.p1  ORF type:complete len:384 (+),score=29.47 TRINITY_DN2696_c0_g1_i1:234-1385(+)